MKLNACLPGAILNSTQIISSIHPANQSLAGEPSRPAKANAWPKRRRFTPCLILVICIFFWLIAALTLCGQDRGHPGQDPEAANHPARFYRAMEK